MKPDRETDLVRACIEMLLVNSIPAWRNNSGATKIGERFIRFGMTGSSDILGVLPGGRFLAVECKMPKGVVTPAQRQFIDAINKAGGLAVVVRSLDELQELVIERKQ